MDDLIFTPYSKSVNRPMSFALISTILAYNEF